VNGLREKIADAIAGTVSQDDRYLEHADAVLRVLAEHGDTQQVEEELVSSGALVLPRGDRINAIMAVVAPAISRARYFNAQDRIRLYEQLERAEADLAAARQQLDQVHDDLAAILRALGLGTHARPISSHDVVVQEVLPAIKHLVRHVTRGES
jgi:hypothetical protein